ncbi:uncharacterized protein [Littorina saxatilis]|uniref:uncharacterized protein n=1 Tax=Littorina saxatilis TaxID=31220 RepID=UPI0038B6A8D6
MNMAPGVSCCVVNCTNARHNLKGQKKNESLRFFRIPKVKTREGEHVRAVTERRRRAWVAAIRRTNITFEHSSDSLRVCSRHFHRGQPAYEMAETDPDWAPSLHLEHEESITMEGNDQVECKVETIKQIVVIEDDVVDLWHTVGASRGLTTDVDVCRFLLSLYFSDGQDATHGVRCGQCNSLLMLVCTKCQGSSQGPSQQGMSSQIHTQQGTHSEICSQQGTPSKLLAGSVFLPASSPKKVLELFSQQLPSVPSSSKQVSPLPISSQLAPSVQPSGISTQESISSNAPFLTSKLPSNSKEDSLTQTLSEKDEDSDGCLDMQVFDSEDSDVEVTFEQAKNCQKSEKREEKDLASATSQPTVQLKSMSEKNRHSKTAFVMLHKCDMPLSTKQSDPSGVRGSSGKGRQTSGVIRRGLVQGSIQTADKLTTVSSQQCPKQQDSSVDTHRESPDTHRGSTTEQDGTSQPARAEQDGTSQPARAEQDGTSQPARAEQDGTSQPARAEQVLVLNVSRFGPRLEPVEEKARPVQQCTVPSCPFETDRSFDMKRHMTKHDKYGPLWLSTQKTARPLQHCIVPACSFATTRSYDMKKHMGKHVAKAISIKPQVVPIKPGPTSSSTREKVKRLHCSVPNCPYATNWTRDMKFHMKKHDKLGPVLKLVEKKAKPIQQCKVPSCRFKTDRNFDMKKHMKKHDKLGSQLKLVEKKANPIQQCKVPSCPFETDRNLDMKKHMKKHDKLASQLKLVEKKAKPIQQCKVPSCPFETDRNFDMKKHMTKHDKYGPQWLSGRKKVMPLQHCCVPACSFATTTSLDMQRHMERHDKEAVSLDIPKKPDPVDSPAPRNHDASNSSVPEDPGASCLSTTGNLDTSNPCASGNLDTSNPCASGNLDTSNPCASGNLDTSNPCASGNLDTSNPCASGNLDTGNPCASGNLDTGNPCASGNLDTSNPCASGNLDTSNPCASGNLDSSHPSAPEKPDVSHSSDHVKLVRNELSVEGNLDHSFSHEHINLDHVDFRAQEKPDLNDFSAFVDLDPSDLSGQVIFDLSEFGVGVKPDPGDSSAQEKPGASATSSHEKPESNDSSSQEKPESSDSTSQKHESSGSNSQEKHESSDSSTQKPESSDSSSLEKHDPSESKVQEKCDASDSRATNKDKRYRCSVPLCPFATNRVREMLRHMRRNEKHGPQSGVMEKIAKPPQHCQEPNCLFATTYAYDMKRHMERHANRARQKRPPPPFWIPNAERAYRKGCRVLYCRVGDCTFTTYSSSSNLLNHMRSKHPSVVGKMKMPLSTKKGPGQTTISHLCDQCGRAYITESGLRGHKKKVHMGCFRYRCDKCDKGFLNKTTFSRHMLLHEDVTCSVCGETWPGKKELQLHMKTTHPLHKCLACEQEGCQATFLAFSELARHMQQTHHLKPERLACKEEGCQATFSLKSDLTRHIRSKHKGRHFVCPVCGLTLSYTFTLTRHMRKCHNMTVTPQRSRAIKKQ